MSDNLLQSLSETIANTTENEESTSNENVSLAVSMLPQSSSKESLSTTSAENIDKEVVSPEQGGETIKSAKSTNADECVEENTEADSSRNIPLNAFSTENEEKTLKISKSTNVDESNEEGNLEADSFTQTTANSCSAEKKEILKTLSSKNADASIEEGIANTKSPTQIAVPTYSAEKEENTLKSPKSTNADESIEEGTGKVDSPTQTPANTCLAQKEEEILKTQKATNDAVSSKEGTFDADRSTRSPVNTYAAAKEEDTLKTKQQSTNADEMMEEETTDADSSTKILVNTSSAEVALSSSVENQNEIITLPRVTEKSNKISSENSENPITTDKDNETRSSSPTVSTDEGEDVNYAQHVTYESDGSAIYIDPKSNFRYKWNTTENNWMPCDSDNIESTATSANPYENDHYKWCSVTQKWLPKIQTQTTETEHYKWDAERREWIPKVVSANADKKTTNSDPTNVTYDIDEDGQRTYTDKDGTVFFWDTTKNAWFPKIDDDFMAHYQMNYGFIDNTSASEEEKQRKIDEEKKLKELELQRMTEEAKAAAEATAAAAKGIIDGTSNTISGGKRKAQEPPKWFELDPEHNTKVYVSNLPLDITLDEFAELMGKCGMIMRDQQTQKYKLKLYAEADGQLKGDGLCDYIKVESVGLALNILDEYNLRGNKIRVQPAEFQMRGEYNPALKPKRKKKDKEKLQKMKEKLFDWRPEKMRGERSKNEKVVIIKNLFDPSIFEKEVQLILDYQNDLREECSKCGTVRKVVIYDRHPEGVAQINMADPEEADVVIQMMQGRYFGQRQLSADHWDGKTKYKIVESEAEVQKRLNNWNQYLTQEENARKNDLSTPQEANEKEVVLCAGSGSENVKDKPEQDEVLEECTGSEEVSAQIEIQVMKS